MKAKVFSQQKEGKKEMNLSPHFEPKKNMENIASYINFVRANQRNAIANTKDRSEVSGGGRKPWRQKGTGRARHGSSRSPIWVGGGVTFGPSSERNFKMRMNKKTRSNYIYSIIGFFANEKRLIILDDLKLKENKTKEAKEIVEKINIEGKLTLILGKEEKGTFLAFRNLPFVCLMQRDHLDISNLVSSDYILMSNKAYAEFIKEDKKSLPQKESSDEEKKNA